MACLEKIKGVYPAQVTDEALAEHVGVGPRQASHYLKFLENTGYLKVTRGYRNRPRQITLTKKGNK